MNLEYVAGVGGYFRIPLLAERNEIIQNVITDFQNNKSNHSHELSLLFNAYTETRLGESIHAQLKDQLKHIHADSGGLQIITLGKENTPEIRDRVYQTQAAYSSVAMCFDEIFLKNESFGNSARTAINAKTVITGDALKCGIATGENIKRQIDVLIENNSKSRPAMILHGNHYDDFMNYYDGMRKVLSDDYMREIKCSAISDTCIGNGVLEGADMISMVKRLDLPEKLQNNVHLLGVGSLRRLLPTIMLYRSGYLDKDINVSYDSTTHTSTWTMGKHLKSSKFGLEWYRITRSNKKDQYKLAAHIYDKYSKHIDFDRSKFIEMCVPCCVNSAIISKRYEETKCEDSKFYSNLFYFLWIMDVIESFTQVVSNVVNSPDDEIRSVFDANSDPIYWLKDVKSESDYLYWRNNLGKYLHSSKIKRDIENSSGSTLSSFFS